MSLEERRKAYLEQIDDTGVASMSMSDAIGYATEMGVSDSLRGLSQLWSQAWGDEEELERLRKKQDKLYAIMTHPEYGTAASGAYFTSAILGDPISWVPLAGWLKKGKSAKNFSDFAKYGASAGAMTSFVGYTPEDFSLLLDDDSSFAMKKLEQTGIGATFGTILSAGGAKGADMYMKARHGKSIFSDDIKIVPNANDANPNAARGAGNPIEYKEGQIVFLKDRQNQGKVTHVDEKTGLVTVLISNADTGKSVRKQFTVDQLGALKPTKKKGRPALMDSFVVSKGKGRQGRVYTLFDSIRSRASKSFTTDIFYTITKSKQGFTVRKNVVQKNTDPELPQQPFKETTVLETFKTLREAKNFTVKQISPNAKGKPKMSRPKYKERIKNNAEDMADNVNENSYKFSLSNIWRRIMDEDLTEILWKKVAASPAETGGAIVGAGVGYSTIDEEDTATEYFAKIISGALIGGGGVKGLKFVDNAAFSGRFQHTIGATFVADYGLSKSYLSEKTKFVRNKNRISADFDDVVRRASKELSEEENKLLYIMMSGDLEDFSKLSSEAINISKDGRNLLLKYGQELVDLGVLDPKTFQKNANSYMKRVYANKNHPLYLEKVGVGTDIRTIANNLKARGFVKDNRVSRAMFEKKWKKQGFEIVRGSEDKNGRVLIRRDFTKQERLALGEMEDFSLSLAETGKLLSNDIAALKFFNSVKNNFSISKQEYDAGVLKNGTKLEDLMDKKDWKQIPASIIKGTNVKKYGDLADRYVDPFVYNDLVHTFRLVGEKGDTAGQLGRVWDSVLGVWKKTKTAWNLGTHTANFMSNMIMIDFAGTSHLYLGKAFKAMWNNDKVYRDAIIHGGMGADMLSNDLRMFGNKFQENVFFRRLQQLADDKHPVEGVGDAIKAMFSKDFNISQKGEILYNVGKKGWRSKLNVARLTMEGMEQLYQLEDQIFRMAVYMDRLDKGFSKIDAAADARKWFIDYDINAPAVQFAKRYALPFVSYTYRVAPLLVEGAVRRPTAVAKWAAIGYFMNALGTWATEDEVGEELDRFTMREADNKKMWNLPFMPSTTIRLPFNSAIDGDAMYLDITRWMPGGDIFLQRESEGAIFRGLPQPLQPGGPLVDLAYMMWTGDDPFTGRPIEDADGSGVESIGPILKHFFSHQLPNMPGVPGSFSSERINTVMKQNPPEGVLSGQYIAPILGFHTPESLTEQGYADYRPSEYAVPYSFWEAFAYGLGIKLKPMNDDISFNQQITKFNQEERELNNKRTQLQTAFDHKGMLPEEYEKKMREFEEEQIEFYARQSKFINSYYALQIKFSEENADRFHDGIKREFFNFSKNWMKDEGNKAANKYKDVTPDKREKKFDGGEVDVPFTKDKPRDRVDEFTGRPYSDQMKNLGIK